MERSLITWLTARMSFPRRVRCSTRQQKRYVVSMETRLCMDWCVVIIAKFLLCDYVAVLGSCGIDSEFPYVICSSHDFQNLLVMIPAVECCFRCERDGLQAQMVMITLYFSTSTEYHISMTSDHISKLPNAAWDLSAIISIRTIGT